MKIRRATSAALLTLLGSVALGVATLSASVVSAETLLERGTYLMQSVVACGNCHTPKGPNGEIPGMELAGMSPFEKTPAFDANAPNITQDRETGIGSWTDKQIIASIREGKRPDGSIIGPPMPIRLYRSLSDWDVQAIVTYLRTVKPVKNEIPNSVYRIPLPTAYGPQVKSVPSVSPDDKIAYGAYLAGPAGHCIECHSPMGKKGPDWVNQAGAGGFEFHGPWGVSVSTNITPTGLADKSYKDVRQMITMGIRPDGTKMRPPMAYSYYAKIEEEDLRAIVSYLRTLPPK